MTAAKVFNRLSAEDQANVLIGMGARTVKNRRDLMKGGLADLALTGSLIRKASGDLMIGSLLDLGTLYAFSIGLITRR